MGDIIATCGCKVKRVMWNISIPDLDKKGNPVTSYLSVCATCYHKMYKKLAITAERC